MALTAEQLPILQADIEADEALNAIENSPDGNAQIALQYSVVASPDYWVWRTFVTRAEYVGTPSPDGTMWSWTSFISRSQGERDGWRELMADGGVNPSFLNVRQGMTDIFSGAQGAAQRAHCAAISRRKANRVEKLYATGTGSASSPGSMVVEGSIDYHDVEMARNLV
jgi:hypothetical protein